jgi:hypothetical protein
VYVLKIKDSIKRDEMKAMMMSWQDKRKHENFFVSRNSATPLEYAH